MAKLPLLSGRELVRALTKLGFEVVRQHGSHVSLQRGRFRTIVPLHHELSRGTLSGILTQCGITREELLGALKKRR